MVEDVLNLMRFDTKASLVPNLSFSIRGFSNELKQFTKKGKAAQTIPQILLALGHMFDDLWTQRYKCEAQQS